MSERDRYEDVGRAARSAIERALADDLTVRQARVLLAALHQTATYSRLGDSLYLDRIVDLARIDRRNVRRALKAHADRGALVWLPSAGRGKRSFLGLPGSNPNRPLVVALEPAKGGQQRPPIALPRWEAWARETGSRFDDDDLVDEIQWRVDRGEIALVEAEAVLEVAREVRREREAHATPDADAIVEFTARRLRGVA